MRVLAFDPGAARCGWCCMDDDTFIYGSGILGIERYGNGKAKEAYQHYRLRLIEYWNEQAEEMLDEFKPDKLVTEIIPPVGGGNFVTATQSHLASTASTVIQAIAMQHSCPIEQVSANTVKRKIGGTKKATKVGVRNGVYELLPLLPERDEWKEVFDESDAYAIALTSLGFYV